jgi:hypothetical protein
MDLLAAIERRARKSERASSALIRATGVLGGAGAGRIDRHQAKPLWPSLLEGPIHIDHPLSFPDHPDNEYVYWAN